MGEVEMVAGQEGNEPVYVAQLILEPNYGQAIADPLTIWFSDLLTSLGDKFNTLAHATYDLPDWAAHAEIMWYGRINKDRHEMEERIAELKQQLSIYNEALNSCQYHIKASNIPHLLRNLQGQSDFPTQQGEQLGQRAGGCPHSTGPGVPV